MLKRILLTMVPGGITVFFLVRLWNDGTITDERVMTGVMLVAGFILTIIYRITRKR